MMAEGSPFLIALPYFGVEEGRIESFLKRSEKNAKSWVFICRYDDIILNWRHLVLDQTNQEYSCHSIGS